MVAARDWVTGARFLGLALTASILYAGCSDSSSSPRADGDGGESTGGNVGGEGDTSGAAGAESGGAGGASCPQCDAFASRDSAELFAWESVPVFDFTLPAERWA